MVIVGGGHNALVAAFYLARGGLKPLVLERRPELGGGAITGELHPGFQCPTLSHETRLHAQIVRDMDLERYGLEWLSTDALVCAPAPDSPALVLHPDVARSVDSIRRLSPRDADVYAAFRVTMERVASVLGTLLSAPPPDIERPGARDLWTLLRAGRRFRALGARDGYRLLRWGPMPAADFVGEWFTNDLLCATLAGPGVSGTMFGPRSAGSALILLMREAHRQLAGRLSTQVRGGPGALTRALAAAASAAGAEIRTGVAVERIVVRDERVTGVVAGGTELEASIVVSGADPKTTFRLVDPAELTPDFTTRLRNYRVPGTLAKVNLALSSLPAFRGLDDTGAALSGRIHIGPGLDYLERAFDHVKYGELSSEPWLEMTIPSVADPQLAPAGAHVASIYVHCAPYRPRDTTWAALREPLLSAVLQTLEPYAPGIRGTVVAAQVITPADLEQEYGFAGGHVFHGELALDQLFAMRPVLGHGQYDSPIRGLFLCGGGTHPGGFMSGASGRLSARAVLRQYAGLRRSK